VPERAAAGRSDRLPDPAEVGRPWLDAYPPGVPPTYPLPAVALTRLLDDAVHDFPDHVAVEHRGHRLSYRELGDHVDRLAAAFAELGVGPGDRIGVLLPNVPQHVVVLFAAWRRGAAVVEVGVRADAETVSRRLDDTGCRLVVCWDPVYDRLAQLKGRLGTVGHVIGSGATDYAPLLRSLAHPILGRREQTVARIPASEGVLRLRDLVDRSTPARDPQPAPPVDAPALLAYPRGGTASTGAVVLTHRNLLANAFQTRLWIPDVKAGQEAVLCVAPLDHVYGVTAGVGLGVLSAATLILEPRTDTDALGRAVSRARPTLLPGWPRLFARLLEQGRRRDLSSLRVCLSAGDALPAEVAAAVEQRTGARLREAYGLTEAAPLTHANPVYGRAKPGSVGLPLPDTAMLLVDPDDPRRVAPPGAPGELAVAGPQVARSYWHRPAATAAVVRDGWLLTGDLASVDADGYVTLHGRKAERTGD